jgi:hypothetical protein
MDLKSIEKKLNVRPDARKKLNKNNGEIINFYDVIPKKYLNDVENPNYDKHNIDIPFRILVISYTGGGKSVLLMNLLQVFPNTFNHILLITRNKSEQLYEYLESKLEKGTELTIQEGLDEFRSSL